MIILVGASASGKTETAKELEKLFNIKKAVTTTTREMRDGEKDGIDYFFIDREEFKQRIKEGKFVENALYSGNYYGCGKDQVAENKVLIVEPNGLKSFKQLNDKSIVSFFIKVSERIRAQRMVSRGDLEENIQIRIKNDREHFALDKIDGIDHIIEADDMSVEEVARLIYDLYQRSLVLKG